MILCFRINNIINNKYFEREPDHLQVLVSVKQWDLHLSDQIVYPLGVGPEWSAVQIKSRRRAETGHDISNILLLLLMCRDHSPLRCRSNVYLCCCRCLLRCVFVLVLLPLSHRWANFELQRPLPAWNHCIFVLELLSGIQEPCGRWTVPLGIPIPSHDTVWALLQFFLTAEKKTQTRLVLFFSLGTNTTREKIRHDITSSEVVSVSLHDSMRARLVDKTGTEYSIGNWTLASLVVISWRPVVLVPVPLCAMLQSYIP